MHMLVGLIAYILLYDSDTPSMCWCGYGWENFLRWYKSLARGLVKSRCSSPTLVMSPLWVRSIVQCVGVGALMGAQVWEQVRSPLVWALCFFQSMAWALSAPCCECRWQCMFLLYSNEPSGDQSFPCQVVRAVQCGRFLRSECNFPHPILALPEPYACHSLYAVWWGSLNCCKSLWWVVKKVITWPFKTVPLLHINSFGRVTFLDNTILQPTSHAHHNAQLVQCLDGEWSCGKKGSCHAFFNPSQVYHDDIPEGWDSHPHRPELWDEQHHDD